VFDLFTAAGIFRGRRAESPGCGSRRTTGPIYGVPKLTLVSRLQALLHEGG